VVLRGTVAPEVQQVLPDPPPLRAELVERDPRSELPVRRDARYQALGA
jgi:hypothetical protein